MCDRAGVLQQEEEAIQARGTQTTLQREADRLPWRINHHLISLNSILPQSFPPPHHASKINKYSITIPYLYDYSWSETKRSSRQRSLAGCLHDLQVHHLQEVGE